MNTRPEIRGTFGMVAATHYLAAAAGMAVLEAGGNAVDASVAAGFTLQVVEPHLNGPGGDMTLLLAEPGTAPQVLCAQGPAPARATVGHYDSLGLELIPGSGLLAAAIPGATAGWLTLLRDRGTRSLGDVLQYAIWYAETGVPVLPSIHRTIAGVAGLFDREWPTSAEIYLPGGRVPEIGSVLTNPGLAATYRRLMSAGRAGSGREAQIDAALQQWSQGFVADAVDSFVAVPHLDSSGRRHAGVLTGADLAGWRPTYESPASAQFGDWTVFKSGPWGQGPVLLQQLELLQSLGVRPGAPVHDGKQMDGKQMDGNLMHPDLVHTVVEVSKLAFADREAWYGDSADVPLADLLSDAYTAERAGLVGPGASRALRPGHPGGRTPRLPVGFGGPLRDPDRADRAGGAYRAAGLGEPTVGRTGRTSGDTCQVDVVDRWGGMVAATPSGGWLQSSPVIPALGFGLGTRLQMMTLEPGLPASLLPGRRPRTTLSPSMAGRGAPELAFGTPGGDQQDQWQLGFLLRLLLGSHDATEAGQGALDLQQAVEGPSFHSTHFPSSFYPREAFEAQLVIEDRFGDKVIGELTRRGHRVLRAGGWTLGRLCAVGRDGATGWMRAAADPRGNQAYAVGR